ncbi:FkbM family methyltransferase [Tranquillimonas alkanivorans]|uniref:Methyltransferase, FkbM family n=1 Tax=Tranquillimonas alkanivorans TaxID=441119 RepID=A0A1I5VQP6_9RHOB|nr:FkbM family methyltransferase [Tranquillimonas alkanivorans]SFQ09743.1 methyltransferase, FkbM family [Tranquillimonas alkanivorans]
MKELLPPSLRVARRALRSWRNGEPELHLLPKLCSRDLLSVDVGANTGVYSWHLARFSAGVIAFEPQPEHAAFLIRAFGRRVDVQQVALSDAPGEAKLRVPLGEHQDGRATIEMQNALTDDAIREIPVMCRRLDSYNLPPTGLVKIDVEGHELSVLRGAEAILVRDRPHLIIEAEDRHRPEALASIRKYLLDFGYRPFVYRNGALVPLEGSGPRDPGFVNFVFMARALVA